MTWAWIDTSSADTGSSQMISLGSTASARAMPMRWRWPPENSLRIAGHVVRAQADGLQQLDDALFELLPGFGQPVNDQRLADDRADIHARIERSIRVLKDDLDVAAQQAKFIGPQRPNILAFKMDLARGRFDQAKHAASGGRFAAAGFADQTKRFAAVDMKIDAVHRMDAAGLDGRTDRPSAEIPW